MQIAAAGHDRCIIPIKEENIEAWLNPDAKNLEGMRAILNNRSRPHCEHRMAARHLRVWDAAVTVCLNP
jgi:hypothetical protein